MSPAEAAIEATAPESVPTVIIEPPRPWVPLDSRDLWAHRELAWSLAVRDIKVRYKQTVIGAAWAVLAPLFTMVIFTVVFGRLAGLEGDTGGVPYSVFAFVALLPWNYFSGTLNKASNSLIASTNLLTKVYFPRLLIPASGAVPGLVDFGIAFAVLLGLLLFFGIIPGVGVLVLPLLILLASLCALGFGMILGALNVEYRDVGFLTGFITQAWMYLSPVIYPSSRVPEGWRPLYFLNPMVGVIDGFRWALLGQTPFPWTALGEGLLVTGFTLAVGILYFRRVERTFADVV